MLTPPPPPSPPPPKGNTEPAVDLIHNILSYNNNVMLAAIISLLLVILFVLLLHVYAKWFLSQARHRSRTSVTVPNVLGAARFHHRHFSSFADVETTFFNSPTKGLDPSVISSIPLFVFKSEDLRQGLECVVCLSLFEDDDVGRRLPKCSHAFHVECIDMWLGSHSSCPICRAPVGSENVSSSETGVGRSEDQRGESPEAVAGDYELEMVVVEVPNSENDDSLSACSSSSSQGESLKRMMSRNRSERKIHPSTMAVESNN